MAKYEVSAGLAVLHKYSVMLSSVALAAIASTVAVAFATAGQPAGRLSQAPSLALIRAARSSRRVPKATGGELCQACAMRQTERCVAGAG